MTATTAVLPSPARVWWLALRPATLAAAVAPVLAGTAVAVHEKGARPLAGLAALVIALAIQIGVNLSNDYSDFVRGADTPERIGPLRASASGVVAPERVKWAAVAAFAVAGLAGLALSLGTDWRLIFVGGACLLAAWLYTGGPRPYGYIGLGATVGTVYVQEVRVTSLAVLAGCGIGFLATAILVLNNLRDIETDAAAGKRTLATRVGLGPTRVVLFGLVCAAFAVPIVILATRLAGVTIMAMLFGIPIAAVPVRTAFAARSGPRLVGALKRMAGAELAYALLMTLGLLLS